MNSPEVFQNKRRVSGFTLVELLLVIALLSIIGTMLFPLGSAFFQAALLDDTAASLASTLRKAQIQAATQKHDSSFGVKIFSDSYVLFEGQSYETRTQSEDEVLKLSSRIEVSGETEVLFEKQTGISSTPGSITMMLGNHETNIEITSVGTITH